MADIKSLFFGALVACIVSSGLHAGIPSLESTCKRFHERYYKDLYNLNFERLEELRNKKNLSLDVYNRKSMKEDPTRSLVKLLKKWRTGPGMVVAEQRWPIG